MIHRLLVANRGEIAVRIIRACREMGIEPIAIYSEADRRSLHVQLAERAVCIGAAPAAESYLNLDAIVAAARATGAEAVHPGYGFLAENADFAERCRAEGLTFVGPPVEAIRLMGDKAAAKRVARAAGVPCVPGYDGEEQSDARLVQEAQRIGYPVLIKASAGGGGKGMHAVHDAAFVGRLLEQARREAALAFGDDRLLLEQLLLRPRHIEVQVLGDQYGALIALGERECSIQRRHQKVIEEAPSPAVDRALRDRLSELAIAVARAAGYSSAGTVEFLLNRDGNMFFLEMNARLQVEHAVTEAVYGIDIVRLQIELASGERLPLRQTDVAPRGHAIECRIYAEDPSTGFLPSTGRVLRFRPPDGAGVRNDVGTYTGDDVGPYYDPLLAKLTVHAGERPAAVDRMRAALTGYCVLGLQTNVSFLQRVVGHAAFEGGDIDIDFLDRQSGISADPEPPDAAFLAAVAAELLHGGVLERGRGDRGPLGGWRMGGQGLEFRYLHSTEEHIVRADRLASGGWRLVTGKSAFSGAIEAAGCGTVLLREDSRVSRYDVAGSGREVWVGSLGQTWRLARPQPPGLRNRRMSREGGAARSLNAPMPGRIIRIEVRPGQTVNSHQVLVVLEAMKMEHAIEAPTAGIVRQIHCAMGDLVSAGAQLVDFDEMG